MGIFEEIRRQQPLYVLRFYHEGILIRTEKYEGAELAYKAYNECEMDLSVLLPDKKKFIGAVEEDIIQFENWCDRVTLSLLSWNGKDELVREYPKEDNQS